MEGARLTRVGLFSRDSHQPRSSLSRVTLPSSYSVFSMGGSASGLALVYFAWRCRFNIRGERFYSGTFCPSCGGGLLRWGREDRRSTSGAANTSEPNCLSSDKLPDSPRA